MKLSRTKFSQRIPAVRLEASPPSAAEARRAPIPEAPTTEAHHAAASPRRPGDRTISRW